MIIKIFNKENDNIKTYNYKEIKSAKVVISFK